MKKFLFICLIFNFVILNAQEDFLCNAINVFNSLGTDAYTEDGAWKQGRSSVLIENTNEDNKYEWNKLQDKNIKTCWSEGVKGFGYNEYILIPFGRSDGINFNYKKAKRNKNIKCCLEINNGNCKSFDSFEKYNRVKTCRIKVLDIPNCVGQDKIYAESDPIIVYDSNIVLQDSPESQKYEFSIILRDDFLYSSPSVILQLIILDVYPGTDYDDTCISEIKVYGEYVSDSVSN